MVLPNPRSKLACGFGSADALDAQGRNVLHSLMMLWHASVQRQVLQL